jgi:hypothetical protein
MAQVFSVNAVGYINLDIPVGFSMIANQLNNNGKNTVADLMPAPPGATTVYKYNGTGYDQSTYDPLFAEWDPPTMALTPGEGAFIKAATAFKLTLVGEVSTGNLVNQIPAGFSIRSSQVPQAGKLVADLKYVPAANDVVYQFKLDGSGYNQSQWDADFQEWSGGEPTIRVGESFFIKKQAAGTWNRTFNVNTP